MYFSLGILYICPVTKPIKVMKHSSYFDAKGIIDFYTKLGKTATADFFRSINEKDTEIVRHGRITWIPYSFVRTWCELTSASPDHAEEHLKEIQSYAIQWIPAENN